MMKVVILGNKNKLLKIKDIAKGTGNFVKASIKDVLNEAVKVQAMQIILVHNHPSGSCEPSEYDYATTKRMREAGDLIGLRMTDHLVMGELLKA